MSYVLLLLLSPIYHCILFIGVLLFISLDVLFLSLGVISANGGGGGGGVGVGGAGGGARGEGASVNKSEVVLDYIVERKRMDDLAGSIIDGRFKEQKVVFVVVVDIINCVTLCADLRNFVLFPLQYRYLYKCVYIYKYFFKYYLRRCLSY